MITELYERTNYLLNIPYIVSSYITEYDLSKANISALKYMHYLSDEDYNFLYNSEKKYREIYIGNLERSDKHVTELKARGILEARKLFFKENQIKESEVLSIKNDAIFVIGNKNMKNNFGLFNFKKKNVYTFFMITSSKIEIYYSYNPVSGQEIIDIKGINDIKLEYHREFMISFLCQIFYMIQSSTIEEALQYYNSFYEDYINLRLDVGYYREFNDKSIYRINSLFNAFGFEFIDSSYLKDKNGNQLINLDCNLALLRDIYGVLSDIYFRTKSR